MSKLNELLKKVNVEVITSDSEFGFENIQDGYYLCEVKAVELTQSKKGDDMIKWQFKIVEEGISHDEEGNKTYIKGTIGRVLFNFHVIKDEMGLNRAISDLLKFEEEEGVSLLEKGDFESLEVLEMALEMLQGKRIFLHLETSESKDGEASQWKRFVSWKGARQIELV